MTVPFWSYVVAAAAGCVFVWASVNKLSATDESAELLAKHVAWLSDHRHTRLLGIAELASGLLLIAAPISSSIGQRLLLTAPAVLMTAGFVTVLSRSLINGNREACGCFGASSNTSITASLWRALTLEAAILVCAVIWIDSAPIRQTDTTISALMIGVSIVGLVALVQLWRQLTQTPSNILAENAAMPVVDGMMA